MRKSITRRLIKEFFIRIFVCRGHHTPTLLEDDDTILCADCGKVLGKNTFYEQEMVREWAGQITTKDPRKDEEGFPRELAEDVASEVGATHVERNIQQARIAEINSKRQQKFAHAEHFKRRQPTTARKLWKPGVKVEEEDD